MKKDVKKRRAPAQRTYVGDLEQQALALAPALSNRRKQAKTAAASEEGPDKPGVAPVCRNAAERMLAIHQLIAACKYPNTARIAREFEVSRKTVKRDVEWMRLH